jgi:hypothetical protein
MRWGWDERRVDTAASTHANANADTDADTDTYAGPAATAAGPL